VATNLLFPHFARAAAAGREEESDRLTRTSIKTLTFIIAPISVGVGVLSDIFVSLIYERGNFTAEHSAITAEALRFYAIGMVFAAICEVLTKAFFAAEKMTIPMISAISAMVFNIAVVLIVGTRLGIWGIALMTAVSAAVNMTLNLIFAQKKGLIKITGRGVLDIAKSVFSAVAMGAVVWLISRYTSGMPRIAAFILPVLAGAAVYILLTLILRSDETMSVIKAVKKKLGGEKK
jgi:putative peptidoglycan lipid II flippase